MTTTTDTLTHFTITMDRHTAIVTMDLEGESMNTLGPRLIDDFEVVLRQLETDPNIRAVVLTSGNFFQFVEQRLKFRVCFRGYPEDTFQRLVHQLLVRAPGFMIVIIIHLPSSLLSKQGQIAKSSAKRTFLDLSPESAEKRANPRSFGAFLPQRGELPNVRNDPIYG